MIVYTIYPETLGLDSPYSYVWLDFITALGWDSTTPTWECASVIKVEIH